MTLVTIALRSSHTKICASPIWICWTRDRDTQTIIDIAHQAIEIDDFIHRSHFPCKANHFSPRMVTDLDRNDHRSCESKFVLIKVAILRLITPEPATSRLRRFEQGVCESPQRNIWRSGFRIFAPVSRAKVKASFKQGQCHHCSQVKAATIRRYSSETKLA
jgi:hypothetical protein